MLVSIYCLEWWRHRNFFQSSHRGVSSDFNNWEFEPFPIAIYLEITFSKILFWDRKASILYVLRGAFTWASEEKGCSALVIRVEDLTKRGSFYAWRRRSCRKRTEDCPDNSVVQKEKLYWRLLLFKQTVNVALKSILRMEYITLKSQRIRKMPKEYGSNKKVGKNEKM